MKTKDLKNIEKEFLELFNYDVKSQTSREKKLNRYDVQTNIGIMHTTFSYSHNLPTIFVRFEDVKQAITAVTNKDRLNHYSGKYNFHGDSCESFIREIKHLTTKD